MHIEWKLRIPNTQKTGILRKPNIWIGPDFFPSFFFVLKFQKTGTSEFCILHDKYQSLFIIIIIIIIIIKRRRRREVDGKNKGRKDGGRERGHSFNQSSNERANDWTRTYTESWTCQKLWKRFILVFCMEK